MIMKIRLDLSSHCVETEIKRLHNRSLSSYFKTNGSEKIRLETTIECLHQALTRMDFSRLRTAHPALAGSTTQEVALCIENDRLRILVDGRPVPGADL